MKRKLFWGLVPAMFIAVLVLMTGCGVDGQPGRAYIGLWVESLEADGIYGIALGNLPANPGYGYTYNGYLSYPTVYYQHQPGTWRFAYQLGYYDALSILHVSQVWSGYLTIAVEPGSPGRLLQDGENGKDRFYDLALGWYGLQIFYDRAQYKDYAASTQYKALSSSLKAPDTWAVQMQQPPDPALYDVGPVHEITKSDGHYRITITEYGYTLKGTTAPLSKSDAQKAAR
jgi:hypothetical protein